MRDRGDHYEYIGTFVDDLLIFSRKCQAIIELITGKYGYKLKNVGPPEYYSGADMSLNCDTGFWEMSAKTYI